MSIVYDPIDLERYLDELIEGLEAQLNGDKK